MNFITFIFFCAGLDGNRPIVTYFDPGIYVVPALDGPWRLAQLLLLLLLLLLPLSLSLSPAHPTQTNIARSCETITQAH